MGKILLFVTVFLCLLFPSCGTGDKQEGGRFKRLDENTPEYQAKAVEHMRLFYQDQNIPVDSVVVEASDLRIKFNAELPDTLYRAYTAQSALEFYKFKKKTALHLPNASIRVYCAGKRGQVAQAIYP